MHRQQQERLLVGQPHQVRTQQWSRRQVERSSGLRAGQVPCGLLPFLGIGDVPQVVDGHVHRRRRIDDLRRLAVVVGDVPRPQDLVARQHAGQRRVEGIGVQWTADAQREGHGVLGASGLQLVEEPQPLLGEAQRQRSAVPVGRHHWVRTGRPVGSELRHGRGQPDDGGCREQLPHRHLHTQCVPES
ncbi:hypothetical protein EES42_23135 [Streptomyces sp. ADI95-17]|nr:hypothetical protein EES42_23135 [Streptomyces sp. ADI95-17]